MTASERQQVDNGQIISASPEGILQLDSSSDFVQATTTCTFTVQISSGSMCYQNLHSCGDGSCQFTGSRRWTCPEYATYTDWDCLNGQVGGGPGDGQNPGGGDDGPPYGGGNGHPEDGGNYDRPVLPTIPYNGGPIKTISPNDHIYVNLEGFPCAIEAIEGFTSGNANTVLEQDLYSLFGLSEDIHLTIDVDGNLPSSSPAHTSFSQAATYNPSSGTYTYSANIDFNPIHLEKNQDLTYVTFLHEALHVMMDVIILHYLLQGNQAQLYIEFDNFDPNDPYGEGWQHEEMATRNY